MIIRGSGEKRGQKSPLQDEIPLDEKVKIS